MKKFEEKEYNACGLAQFCANQDDYGTFININEYAPDPIQELEERVRKNLFFF